MEEENKEYTHEQLSHYTDSSLIDLLRSAWRYEPDKPFYIIGRLSLIPIPNRSFHILEQLRNPYDGTALRYPLLSENIKHTVFVGNPKDINNNYYSQWVKILVDLSPKEERDRHHNPFSLRMVGEEITLFEEIPQDIFDNHDKLEDELRSKRDALNNKYEELKGKLEHKSVELEKVEQKIDLRAQKVDELQNDLKDLSEKKKSQVEEFKKQEQKFVEMEQAMAKNIDRLREYIKDRAEILKKLEFIDEQEFDELFLRPFKSPREQASISFSEDLQGSYSQAASYIQAYLLGHDILYPKHVIENFFALIRSNDLIILAGDSGSGKTNLVQSFATAIGGVSKIIPVKPNWTSSEDLLGYYNPLEKKFLATPFLEALIEAKNNPNIPYLICLDEMNLARVEYYFADFLSKLEQRGNAPPEIQLYSDNESSHVLSELRHVIEIIDGAKEKYKKDNIVDFIELLQDMELNAEIKRAFGFSENDSLIKYHSDIRRMLSGVINTPASIKFPANVRIIGAINIDETTHYLSPKILDRAHIMKFRSPLLTDWSKIYADVQNYSFEDVKHPISFDITDLGSRDPYPKFDKDDQFCKIFVDMNRDYFHPLGVEFGMRTIRQGLNYLALFSDFNSSYDTAVNNFLLHKVFPKFTFDGNKDAGEVKKSDLLHGLSSKLEETIDFDRLEDTEFSALNALDVILKKGKANDWVVNYWS